MVEGAEKANQYGYREQCPDPVISNPERVLTGVRSPRCRAPRSVRLRDSEVRIGKRSTTCRAGRTEVHTEVVGSIAL